MLQKSKCQRTRKGRSNHLEEIKEEEKQQELSRTIVASHLNFIPIALLSLFPLLCRIPVSLPGGGKGHLITTACKSQVIFLKRMCIGHLLCCGRSAHCLMLLRI